jgi:hypothetical protein
MSIPTIDTPTQAPTAIPFAHARDGVRTSRLATAQRTGTLVAARSWDEVFEGPSAPASEPIARRLFREAVAAVAERARQALPQCGGRVDKAVQIVLAGDVIPHEDGRFFVGSQSDPDTQYVVAGECDCQDSDREALQGWCKHKLASAIYTRATAQVKACLLALETPAASAPPAAPPPALPEAPASANVHVQMGCRLVHLTLRDTDEQRLLVRLEALLARFPEDAPAPAAPEPVAASAPPAAPPVCPLHRVPLEEHTNAKGRWWSHWVASERRWCKGA